VKGKDKVYSEDRHWDSVNILKRGLGVKKKPNPFIAEKNAPLSLNIGSSIKKAFLFSRVFLKKFCG
jgi:hypothetical protein